MHGFLYGRRMQESSLFLLFLFMAIISESLFTSMSISIKEEKHSCAKSGSVTWFEISFTYEIQSGWWSYHSQEIWFMGHNYFGTDTMTNGDNAFVVAMSVAWGISHTIESNPWKLRIDSKSLFLSLSLSLLWLWLCLYWEKFSRKQMAYPPGTMDQRNWEDMNDIFLF